MGQGFFGVEQQGIVLGEIFADIKNFSFWDDTSYPSDLNL